MNTHASTFPLSGVIGIVSNSKQEIDLAIAMKLKCVEIRGDLLLDNGHSESALMDIVSYARNSELGTLLTIRLPSHGGTYSSTETQRQHLNEQGLSAGAHIIDVEWGSNAAIGAAEKGLPFILSQHNFTSMINHTELEDLTQKMMSMDPVGIKVVPTGQTSEDGLNMLTWVSEQTDQCRRIGFTMGAAGEFSRILTCALGAPISYASFGKAVAPGQVAIERMVDIFNVSGHNSSTHIFVSLSENSNTEFVDSINQIFRQSTYNAVLVELINTSLATLLGSTLLPRLSGVFINSLEIKTQPETHPQLRWETPIEFRGFIENTINEKKNA